MIFDKQLIPKNIEEYNKLYKHSITNPEEFWADVASSFIWKKNGQRFLNMILVNQNLNGLLMENLT